MNQKWENWLDSLRNKKILVLGIGVSNRPLIRMLLKQGLDVTACDKTPREKADAEVLELERAGAKLRLGENYLEGLSGDLVFRTPGMRPDIPALEALRTNGAEVTSEMEAFFAVCPCRIIAVTGSDGKTTTTTIISKMLEHAGYRVWLGGNIGAPLLDRTPQMTEDDFAVVELSSFQLMTMRRSPTVAVVTNVAPNHLDIHKDMAEYVAAKKNVFCNVPQPQTVVLNADNDITRGFAADVTGTVRLFSRREQVETGAAFRDGTVFLSQNGVSLPVLEASQIRLPGLHNVENYMAAFCAVQDYVSADDMRAVAEEFPGVEHRIEFVRELRGVKIYNDSIASSPTRTTAGLHAFPQKVILIAGGYDKHIPFDGLGREICTHVKALVLCGATAGMIENAVRNAPEYPQEHPQIITLTDFAEAVKTAVSLAKPGDVVTLSPACAAFDQFKNFMVRGETFKKLVMELE